MCYIFNHIIIVNWGFILRVYTLNLNYIRVIWNTWKKRPTNHPDDDTDNKNNKKSKTKIQRLLFYVEARDISI